MALIGTLLPEKASILVAEDHPLNQMFMKKALERFGVGHFEVVPNGLEALKRYNAQKWDMILMDCHMPEVSGYDATRAIRDIEKKNGGHISIIAMTANTTEGEREKCLQCGMDEYISKPINVSELRHLLGRWMKFEDDDFLVTEPQQKKVFNNQAPVDLAKLRAFANKDPALEKEMARIFIEQSDKNMVIMKQACAKKNHKLAKETAHMFKGGAASLGADTLSQICDRMETFEGTDGGRAALVEALAKEYSRVKHHLEELGLLEQQAS